MDKEKKLYKEKKARGVKDRTKKKVRENDESKKHSKINQAAVKILDEKQWEESMKSRQEKCKVATKLRVEHSFK